MNTDLRFPIGEYEPKPFSVQQKIEWLAAIKFLPLELDAAVNGWSDEQLDTPYRDGGWTVRQLVHHIADSHINAYCRFKLALTETDPEIKPYDENAWAQLNDTTKLPIDVSLILLHSLHLRWHEVLKHISDNDWNNRSLFHPQHKKLFRLWYMLGSYAWHGKHHTAHILKLKERMNW